MEEELLTQDKDERIRRLMADMALFPEMNPGPVTRLDREGKVLLANTKAKKVFGSDDLVGHSWFELCPGMNEKIWKAVLGCGDVYPFESKVGNTYMVFNHVCPAPDKDIFVYGTDITALKLTQQELEEQKATVAEIARFPDMNPGPVLRMDLEGNVLLSNAAATTVFGKELEGKCWRDICPGISDALWDKIVTSPRVVPVEVHIGDKEFIFNHRRDYATDLVFAFGADITMQRLAEKSLRQSERMATLGTLAAGVAHELNNPAAATRRAAMQLKEAFTKREEAHAELDGMKLSVAEWRVMIGLAQRTQEAAVHPAELDALSRSDKEAELEEWLEEKTIEEPWNISPALVNIGIGKPTLDRIASEIQETALGPILLWVATLYPVYALLYEIAEGSNRISEIVVALKNYSYLGQAPVQEVNLHDGIDNTLIILKNKLKVGINVTKEYSPDLPHVMAHGSELNQVWTNILDNAADAMNGKGEITIRTSADKMWATVEIEDNGPGIPEEIQERIFDPFFTTKEPGKGTGLGLSTSYGIITEKHKGLLDVESRPGMTKFTIKLPLNGKN